MKMKKLSRLGSVQAGAVIVAVLFGLSAGLVGCATKIKVNMLQPAKHHRASLTKTVAVLPFEGPGGAEFASEVESVLAGVMVNGKPYFTLVDRMNINRTLSELELSQTGLLDEKTASRVGKMLGAEGIYTGRVIHSDVKDSPSVQARQECVRYQILYDKKGKPFQGPCLQFRQRLVKCTERVASFTVNPKLVSVSTGQILYAQTLTDMARSYGCEDGRPPESGAVLLKHVKDNVKNQLRRDIAPFYVTEEIALMDLKDMIPTAEAREKLKQGIEFAGGDRMDRACELWEEARAEAPDSPALLFNLGVCAESRGDFETALAFYRSADRLMMKPDDNITSALKRAEKAIENQKKLGEEMR